MNLLRAVPAALLAGASAVLSGGAKLAELGARRLAPPSTSGSATPPSPSRVADAASERVEAAGAVIGDAVSSAGTGLADRVEATSAAAADTLQDAGDSVERSLREAEADADADSAGEADLPAGSDLLVDADLPTDLTADADLTTDADLAGPTAAADPLADADASADLATGDATAATLPPQPDDTGVVVDLPPSGDSIIDDQGGQARTYESHIAQLADQNVSAVVRGIQDLSTEELGQLFDYESAHRKRKTVLQAIERAAAPEAEETVYTSESPGYEGGNPPL